MRQLRQMPKEEVTYQITILHMMREMTMTRRVSIAMKVRLVGIAKKVSPVKPRAGVDTETQTLGEVTVGAGHVLAAQGPPLQDRMV